MKIYPVIHYIDRTTALSETRIAKDCGADGVFLISHRADDDQLSCVAAEIKKLHPDLEVGINLLTYTPNQAIEIAAVDGLDMVWLDYAGVSSSGLDRAGELCSYLAKKNPKLKVFGSVAFKYQRHEPLPAEAAKNALDAGFLPTTSGVGTGQAADIFKIWEMSKATNGLLACASGITPSNVILYAPLLSHVLVSTGISIDDTHMDPQKLKMLVANANLEFKNAWYSELSADIQRERTSAYPLDIESELLNLCLEELKKHKANTEAKALDPTGVYVVETEEGKESFTQSVIQDRSIHTLLSYKPANGETPESIRHIKKQNNLQIRAYVDPNSFEQTIGLTDFFEATISYRGVVNTFKVIVPINGMCDIIS